MEDIRKLTEEEKAEIWNMIGGTPHLYNDDEFTKWTEEGEVPDGLMFGALEIFLVGQYLAKVGYTVTSLGGVE